MPYLLYLAQQLRADALRSVPERRTSYPRPSVPLAQGPMPMPRTPQDHEDGREAFRVEPERTESPTACTHPCGRSEDSNAASLLERIRCDYDREARATQNSIVHSFTFLSSDLHVILQLDSAAARGKRGLLKGAVQNRHRSSKASRSQEPLAKQALTRPPVPLTGSRAPTAPARLESARGPPPARR
jgi:hypothetical protein